MHGPGHPWHKTTEKNLYDECVTLVFRSRTPITLNEWHVVRISRTGRDGYMQIDNQAAVEGMSKGAYTQLTLTLDLFIGGHRNFDEVAKNARVTASFKGCIQKVSCLFAFTICSSPRYIAVYPYMP